MSFSKPHSISEQFVVDWEFDFIMTDDDDAYTYRDKMFLLEIVSFFVLAGLFCLRLIVGPYALQGLFQHP